MWPAIPSVGPVYSVGLLFFSSYFVATVERAVTVEHFHVLVLSGSSRPCDPGSRGDLCLQPFRDCV